MASRIAAWRASLASIASRIYPGLDEALWNSQRNRITRAARRTDASPTRGHRAATSSPTMTATLALIATGDGADAATWAPATGNHFFEVAQSAAEQIGADRVLVLRAFPGEDAATWQHRMIDEIHAGGVTHVMANVETDPYDLDDWNWDVFVDRLRASWSGTLMALMYDSAYAWTIIRARRLAKRDPQMLIVALDRPMAGLVPPSRAHVGPVLLPISKASQQVIADAVDGLARDIDVSFIGALYPYRVPVLDMLAASGVIVTVNPQRPDVTRNYEESRANQPGYLAYMGALARSQVTLNLSRANEVDVQQLKTRLIEAALVGCLVVTDDHDRSDHYFDVGTQFARFHSLREACTVISTLLADRVGLAERQASAQARARAIAATVFWSAVDDGLTASGLAPVMPGKRVSAS